jgi:putative tryptophan/tyrosine transport system substrate-binding protein
MDRRALLLATSSAGLLTPLRTFAALPSSAKRLGVLLFDRPEPWAFFPPQLDAELAALGWVERRNLSIDWRYANGDPALVRAHVAELVASAPDAILTRGTPVTRALQLATKTIPIVTGVGDPIGSGFAQTYAQPGGNITGISWAIVEMEAKNLELLRLMVPKLALLHVVLPPRFESALQPMAGAARSTNLSIRQAVVTTVDELRAVLATNNRSGEVAAMLFGLPSIDPEVVARVALEARMPTMFQDRGYVDAGGLASYRLNWTNQTQRSAAQIDKIFRGEKPGLIPFELPTVSEFVLNRKTARLLGIELPQDLLLRADAVVE